MPFLSEQRTVKLLIIEDNAGDIRLIREAVYQTGLDCEIRTAQDSNEAFDLLRRPKGKDFFQPDLICLDLKLPRRDGTEILSELKTDPELKRIPVIILTSSKSEQDILKCYELHANCYLTKPILYKDLEEIADRIKKFWFETVRLPNTQY